MESKNSEAENGDLKLKGQDLRQEELVNHFLVIVQQDKYSQ